MGCWNNNKLLTAHVRAVSAKDLAVLVSLPSFCPSRQTALFHTLLYYRKPCIYRARAGSSRLPPPLRKEPDYSLFRLLLAPRSRSLPARAVLWLLPAGSGTFMFHNLLVRAESGAQRGGLFPCALRREAGSIQHSGFQEDAKLFKAAAPRKQLCCFSFSS